MDEDACEGCETCIDHGRFGAVSMKDDKAFVDVEKCFGCGSCVVMCPVEGAVRLEPVETAGNG
ncbi:DUF362 domain-containing protein [Thermodesulfobacteriota bacterium]